MALQIHINDLVNSFKVVCVQESWHLSLASLKNDINAQDVDFHHKFASKISKKGRPSGGLVFIVNNQIKCSSSFPSDRIDILKIGTTAIIQVYLPFNDGTELTSETFVNSYKTSI